MTPEDLVSFEKDIEREFEAGRIKAPVHFAGGNEHSLVEIFENIALDDWVLTTWRGHYHALLKGVPPDQVKSAIMRGRSIALCFPEHKILSSAIVGGICPIATGLGWAIKERGGTEHVHVFVGDMTAMTGIYAECLRYCSGHTLPVTFYVEDNALSVCTDTKAAWGASEHANSKRYEYKLAWPHVGIGKWVRF